MAKTDAHRAGLFDIRTIIGALMGTYGLILLLLGIFGDPETDKTGGTNANLWAGLAMLVVGAAFLAWVRLRPLSVPEPSESPESSDS